MSAPSNTLRYEYRGLDSPRSFRLLKLTKGAKSDPLECELSVHKLQDLPCGVRSTVPEFQALSYFAAVLAAFFDNPWFSRVWVVQEVFESRKCRVLFGEEEEVPWLKVIALARWLIQSRGKESIGVQVLRLTKTNGVQNALFMHSGSTIWAPDPIPGLLQSVRDFGCTDPRDKVYAVLHMPFKQALVYRRMSFLASSKYLHFFVQGTAMMCILIQLCRQDPTDLLFWSLLLSVSYMTHHMVTLARTVARDFFQRLLNFIYTVDRVLLHDYKYSDTLQNALSNGRLLPPSPDVVQNGCRANSGAHEKP
ncbi:unnamed protein product [Parascedosporium putredinis]|uniref:Heterokaryon incompatibility domain-containing protein n=1 Tax=Parascedosporium putredinis TaxID=1442378 RepID=A0A9P1H266_9PEZI|nr:unnamed protein product [Parascedosporium putredinis]CAI7994328.1 unnamed protein product [Parascedosporium putredinis]